MLDRQDLDALLVGALYGELTPADSERLAQHLESHPADKVALDDMTRARKAVQDSRIFATMAEPPQAVSALLLQEAHRRVPKVARAPEPAESWFQRFLKSFVAHPAMAAATMLVLVAGVAGTLYVRNGQLGADEKVATTQPSSDTAEARVRDAERELDRGAASAAGSSTAFQAQLDDQVGARAAPVAPVTSPPAADPTPSVNAALQQQQELTRTQNQLAAAHASHSSGVNGGLVVRRPEPTVKELPGDNEGDVDGTIAAGDTVAPASTTAAPAPTPARVVVNGPGAGGGAAAPTGQAVAPRLAPAQPAAPPPPPADAPRDLEKKGDANANVVTDGKDKDASDSSLLAWAKQQHQKIVQLVQQKKCDDVVNLALKLQDRAPDYYNQNVATDRAVAPCGSYISQERSRRVDAQKRAAKPANADSTK